MPVKNSVYNRVSRYVQGGETEVYSKRLGWWERDSNTFSPSADDIYVTIAPKHNKRPDKMAADLYGRSYLGWIILQYNNIIDINEEFISGKVIRVPEPSRTVINFLGKNSGGKKVQENI